MDELFACPSSSCSHPHSPPSLFSFAGASHHPVVLEFESCDVPEQWLEDDCGGEGLQETVGADDAVWRDGASPHSAGKNMSGEPPPPAPTKRRRGRKPGPRTNGPVISHVEAERQRRDKLNRRFCELRAAVPTVSRMDRASLLADAAAYIAELRGRVQQLEAESGKKASAGVTTVTAAAAQSFAGGGLAVEEDLEVRMLGREAAVLRLTSSARHAPERLMVALRSLDLPVQHACVCRVGGMMTVQDAVVDVPAALGEEGRLRAALLQSLQGRGQLLPI